MSPEQAAWVGVVSSLFVWAAIGLGHYLLCNCPRSRRCRAHQHTDSPKKVS